MLLRKDIPGSDSFGHEWRTPRSVVEVPDGEAAQLLAIGGFTVVEPSHDDSEGDSGEVTEPAPVELDAADATGPTIKPKKATGRRVRTSDIQE